MAAWIARAERNPFRHALAAQSGPQESCRELLGQPPAERVVHEQVRQHPCIGIPEGPPPSPMHRIQSFRLYSGTSFSVRDTRLFPTARRHAEAGTFSSSKRSS